MQNSDKVVSKNGKLKLGTYMYAQIKRMPRDLQRDLFDHSSEFFELAKVLKYLIRGKVLSKVLVIKEKTIWIEINFLDKKQHAKSYCIAFSKCELNMLELWHY
ncbi:hypothetical protein [Vibrio mediterranei]|uniref:Uncharacterized protein n=1 Tax=Vibrio mediterranei TaxID=689 RepID=A0A3G4V983_9VIBR|nr:hypothetical protein [Vibrio mediterranei]AYV21025.1 hypothetical protein ECB94_06730 [Vibrio mediterranei]